MTTIFVCGYTTTSPDIGSSRYAVLSAIPSIGVGATSVETGKKRVEDEYVEYCKNYKEEPVPLIWTLIPETGTWYCCSYEDHSEAYEADAFVGYVIPLIME